MALLAWPASGCGPGFFGPISVLLAQQAEALGAANKEQVLALVTRASARWSSVLQPAGRRLLRPDDARAGRRLPWLVGGALGGAASLAVLSVAPNVAVMLLGWCGVQAALNAMLAAVTAMIPDQVPSSRRGRIGGIVAVAQTIGVVAGTGIAAATGSIAAGYLVHRGVPAGARRPVLAVARTTWRCRPRRGRRSTYAGSSRRSGSHRGSIRTSAGRG